MDLREFRATARINKALKEWKHVQMLMPVLVFQQAVHGHKICTKPHAIKWPFHINGKLDFFRRRNLTDHVINLGHFSSIYALKKLRWKSIKNSWLNPNKDKLHDASLYLRDISDLFWYSKSFGVTAICEESSKCMMLCTEYLPCLWKPLS